MREWFVDVQSMVPNGECGDRMVIARIDNMAGTVDIMQAPELKSYALAGPVPLDKAFMESNMPSGSWGADEIDQFLLAMMEAGWKRGLRPAKFDPSAGELMAVNRHLEDM